MTKKVIVILADGFEEIEASASIDILRRAGLEVTVAGLKSNTIKGSRGIVIIADKKFDEIKETFDALVLPGGSLGAKNLYSSEAVRKLIDDMNKNNKVIAAICASPAIVLSPIGILKNKSATCYPGMEDSFENDVKFKEDSVIADGNIITSRGAGTSIVFSLKIVEKLCGVEVMEKIKKSIVA